MVVVQTLVGRRHTSRTSKSVGRHLGRSPQTSHSAPCMRPRWRKQCDIIFTSFHRSGMEISCGQKATSMFNLTCSQTLQGSAAKTEAHHVLVFVSLFGFHDFYLLVKCQKLFAHSENMSTRSVFLFNHMGFVTSHFLRFEKSVVEKVAHEQHRVQILVKQDCAPLTLVLSYIL